MLNVSNLRNQIDQYLADFRIAHRQAKEEKEALVLAKQKVIDAEEAQRNLQAIAQQTQQKAHDHLASLVTKALETVFEDGTSFKIVFERKRGKTDARLVFIKEGHELDPYEDNGGGAIDVAQLALRLACLMLARPKRRKLLVLDEPFKAVNGEGPRQRLRILLTSLAKDYDVQMIIATGLDYLRGLGKEVEL